MKASTRDGHKQTTNHCIFLQCFTKVKNLFFFKAENHLTV